MKLMANPDNEQDADTKFLTGHLLLATTKLDGSFFAKSVIYVCAHSKEGAMGIVINQPIETIQFHELLEQLNLKPGFNVPEPVVHLGGPVDTSRGFVLHSTDVTRTDTLKIDDHLGITGTTDILRQIAEGKGPSKSLLALGYAGWGPGQLEQELQENSWLTVSADDSLIFDHDLNRKWEKALKKLGVDPVHLSGTAGTA